MNGIMGDTVFCNWFLPAMILFSRFTCAVAYIRISCVENKRDYQKRKRGGGINWKAGIDIYTLLYIK